MTAKAYKFLEVSTVQCPKCNCPVDLRLCRTDYVLEYAAVCVSAAEDGGRCGTTLRLRVASHRFPAHMEEAG
jgi:hypothetical protein